MKALYKLLIFFTVLGALRCGAQAPAFAWLAQQSGGADIVNSNIALDNANHFVYVAGTFQGNYLNFGTDVHANMNPSSGSNDIFVAKFTLDGQLVWGKTFGGYGTDQASGLAIDPWGNILISGQFYSDTLWFDNLTLVNNATSQAGSVYDAFLVKLDPSGNPVWGKIGACNADAVSYVSPAGTNTLAVDNAGNAFFTGSFNGTVNFDSYQVNTSFGACMFAVKVDTAGVVKWAAQNTSLTSNLNPGATIAEALTVDNAGNCIIAGWYSDDVKFGTHNFAGDDFHTSRFQTKLNSTDGSYIWATGSIWTQLGGEQNYGIACDNAGNIYLTGLIPDSAVNANFFIEKRNPGGNVDWIIHDTAQFVLPLSITADAEGNSYLSMGIDDTDFNFGGHNLHTPAGNIFGISYINTSQVVIKTDSSGAVQWIKGTNPSLNSQSAVQPGDIITDNNGYIYITGGVADTCSFDNFTFTGDPFNSNLFVARLGGTVSSVPSVADDNGVVSIYPNPSNNLFNFHFSAVVSDVNIRICNVLGKQVAIIEQANGNDIIWRAGNNIAAGVYVSTITYRPYPGAQPVHQSRMIVKD